MPPNQTGSVGIMPPDMQSISSPSNPFFKQCKLWLEKSKKRKQDSVVLVEGMHEIECALRGKCEPLHWVQPDDKEFEVQDLASRFPSQYELSSTLFSQLVLRKSGQVALAVLRQPQVSAFELSNKGRYLVVESVEKPGNLGAILRSVDASGIEGVIICDPKVDVFNPQVIRNSVGSVFSVPVWVVSAEEAYAEIAAKQLRLYSTFMEQSESFWTADLGPGCAVVIGTEHEGVSDFWKDKGENIQIPMQGSVDSLNVSVAAALLVFEMARRS
jgi:TrmH family RNA methyltransferase